MLMNYLDKYSRASKILGLSSLLFFTACNQTGEDFKSLLGEPKGSVECEITNSDLDNSTPQRVSGLPSGTTTINLGLSATECEVTYKLNGTEITPVSAAKVVVNSSDLQPGNNVLSAETGTSVKTWTLVKNNPPVCGTQTPASGVQIGVGGTQTFNVSASDADTDAMTFGWLVNGSAPSSVILTSISSASSSQAVFLPDSSLIGSATLSAEIDDGIDKVRCEWAATVNDACTISNLSPSNASSTRVSGTAGTTTTFQASAGSGCNFSWKLNGATISGANSSVFNLDSTDLLAGSNTLEASVGNGSSADSETWIIVKNIAPTCASQTPAATGNNLGVGGSLTLTANGNDLNNDPLTFTWTNNGNPVGSEFATSATGASGSATFSPDSNNAGSNTVRATISDGIDSAQCSWTVQVVPVCTIASSSPSGSTLKVPARAAATTTFLATPNDSSCNLSWQVNGNPVSGATLPVLNILSSQLIDGSNTIVATASNGYSSATRSWTVTKNQAPTCASQTPAMSGNSVGVGGTITFLANAGNADSDTLTYNWSYNGSVASPIYFATTNSGNSSQAIFSPTVSLLGSGQTVAVSIDDGYDTNSCTWNVNVLNACLISGTTPLNPGPVKVPNASSGLTNFQATANPGCNYTWSLNGTPVSGASSSSYLLPSSSLIAGTNVLQVSVSNGITSDTKAWQVVKNTPPACASLNPSNASAVSVGAGGNLTLQATASNTDSDSLTFNWLYNGTDATASVFTPTFFGNSAQLVFSPNDSYVGNNQIATVRVDDGYDNVTCSWNVNVLNSCVISNVFPSNSTAVKVPALGSTNNTFQASANAGCNYSWTLNGVPISGQTASSLGLLSSALSAGNNTLVVSVTNGTSSDSKTWNVVKNTPPICASQTPASTGNTLAVGSSVNLVANATDADSDTISFIWKNNGTNVGSQFGVVSAAGTSTATFAPDTALVGTNSVQANISDGYDSALCSWSVNVLPACTISSANPSASTFKVANAGTSNNNFVATPSDVSCNISWSLNGSTLAGQTNPLLSLTSSQFLSAPSSNTLVATATNGFSTATRTWTIVKNQVPFCSSQTPSATGNQMAANGTRTFQLVAGNPDSDPLTYSWTLNGASVSSTLFAITSSGNNSQSIYSPTSANVANGQTIAVTMNDDYDTATCSWTVDVLPQCLLSSFVPSTASTKVSANASTNTGFSAAATTGCNFTWSLNGSPISGATSNNYTVASSALNTGDNTLVATVTNGVSSDSRTWTVVKNTPPSCGTQTPSAAGNSVGVGGTLTFNASATNTDSDTMSYSWKYNGSAANSSHFSTSFFGNSAQAVFTPNSSYIGNSQTVAVELNDSYDTATCTWDVNIQNACTLSNLTPGNGSAVRVANAASTTNNFQASANPGCTFTWSLNGTPIVGATSSTYPVVSGDLTPGNNILTVSVTNGSSTDTKTWTVVRNTPPVCASQTPAATGTQTAVTANLTYTANGTDANNDPLTFNWRLNGSSAPSQFSITNGTGTSQAIFSPDASAVGMNAITSTISDGYDSVACTWVTQVLPACQIGSSSPSGPTLKVPNASSSTSNFIASPNDSSCLLTWTLNGSPISGAVSAFYTLSSSQLNAGPATNALVATASNGLTTASRTWTVTKNQVPTCSSQTPSATGQSVGVGGSITLSGTSGNPDTDTHTYSWTYNGAPVGTGFATSSSGDTAQAVFTPTSGMVGSNQSIVMRVDDGYDTANCSWTLDVANACVIASTSPSTGTSVRMPNASTGNSTFTANANPGCNYAWTLNGVTVSGATSASLNLSSASLTAGLNTLVATASNGTSTDSKTWNVVKNSPPICSGQSPASTGTVLAIGGTVNLQASAVDANGDSLTFAWQNNGATAATGFSISSATNNPNIATMTGVSGLIGSNNIKAQISDGYDTSSCDWTVQVKSPCTITSASPSSSTLKMGASGTYTSAFISTVNDSACAISWRLNGNLIPGETSSLYNLTSAQLNSPPAPSTLVVTATDGNTTDTRTWTITKNVAPSCSSQTPTATGSSVGVGGTLSFTANASNTDADTLTYSWLYNGAPVSSTYFTVTSSGDSSLAVFSPPVAYVGTGQAVVANINDGYDSASCSWTTSVRDTCSIASPFPLSTTYKIPFASGSSTTFGGIPSDATCAATWTLNGVSVGSGPLLTLSSPSFNDGPAVNELTLTLNNGVAAPTTRTWYVTKNRVPQCSAQTPSANPSALPYTSTRTFSGTGSDPDSDALSSFTWLYNGNVNSALFSNKTQNGNVGEALFTPTFSQVGSSQVVGYSFSDGYDSGNCSWTYDITNPNTITISACLPSANPIVLTSTGATSSQTLQVVASNATSNGYSWNQNGNPLNGFNSSSFSVSSSNLPPGNYTFRGIGSDAQGNTAYCDFNVKSNAPPVISSASPANTQTWRVNYGATMNFSVSATDANVGDNLTYTWTVDGVASPALPSLGASTVFSPNYDTDLVGTRTIAVNINDGYESVTRSWTVEVNVFTQQCNNLYNSPVDTLTPKICTLVGTPGMGAGLDPSLDQTQVRIQPVDVIDDGQGNLIFSDLLNHTVNFYNRSSSAITRWGTTFAPNTLGVIVGRGASGLTPDNLNSTNFKLNQPYGIAYDSATHLLYVADYGNHRIVSVDNTGMAKTVVGPTNGVYQGNTIVFNTDGNSGANVGCQFPVDVMLVNQMGARWLYMTCSGQHAIKRMDALPSSPDYQKVYTIVGRVVAGAISAGWAEGSLGPTGDSLTNVPWTLASDTNGNIYWTESSGYRIRGAMTGGATTNFFDGSSFALTTSITGQTTTIRASHVNGPLTLDDAFIRPMAAGGVPTKISIQAPASIPNNVCVPVYASLRDASNVMTNATSNTTLTFASSGAGAGNWYANSSCTGPTNNQATITTGTSTAVVYFRSNSNGTPNIAATSSPVYTTASHTSSVASTSVATKIVIVEPRHPGSNENHIFNLCQPLILQLQNASNVASTSASNVIVRMSTSSIGNFFADADCATTPVNNFIIASGTSTTVVYYKSTVIGVANQSVSIVGNVLINGVNPSNNTSVNLGLASLRHPRGLAVTMSGGNVTGFFVSNWDQQRIFFVNNTNIASNIGGTNIGAYQVGVVAGTGTGGFNSDGLGNITRIFQPLGLTALSTGELLIADTYNYRIRSLQTGVSNGQLNTILGAGRARLGNLGDAELPAPTAYLNNPANLVVDNTNRLLYVSDSANGRIRRLNLLTGFIETVIGRGQGAATVEQEDPTNTFMQSPKGLALLQNGGGTNFLIYADQQSTGANQNCQIRALNLTPNFGSPPPASIFGTAVNAYKIATLAGDYTLGCTSVGTLDTGSNLGNSLSTRLYNPEGIAYDGSNLLITMYNDHCILKLDPSGNMTVALGRCNSSGYVDGPTSSARTRLPSGIVMDPLYLADGNYFFVDQIDQNPSRVRYVNCRSTSVSIAGNTVAGATAPHCTVASLWAIQPSGNSPGHVFGVAAFGPQLCIAGGQTGANSGGVGSHNVTCWDRSNNLGPVSLRVGPNESTNPPIRGGAPLSNSEQENTTATSAYVSAPYGLAFDSAGNLYISERNNGLIRMVRRWW